VPPPRPTPAVVGAEAELAARDPVVAGLVGRWGPCPLRPRFGGRGHFEALARSIVYQQLAGRAAEAIWLRVRALVPGRFDAAGLAAVPEGLLRSAGLSGAKTRSLSDLAARVHDGDVRLDRVGRLDDEAVVTELSRVRGIGRWTAEMFLMFQLGRLDVWPTGDLGVRKGFAAAWGEAVVPSPLELAARGEPFRPWRSVVAWYCWQAVRTAVPA
jgi:DNA-3-methyladenine glycosylase II